MADTALESWLARLETLHPRAMELGLERVATVADALGLRPVNAPVITVAGTNGKGSTVAVLEALAAAAGVSAGVYTSPHLLRFNERIRVAGAEVPDADIVAAFEAIEAARGAVSLTYFEFATLAALLVFRRRQVSLLVLEVGLGGRLDAVNIIDPDVAVITSIDLDHQEWLGVSRAAIAPEKAGILRGGRPAVIADPAPPPELAACAAAVGAGPVLWLGSDFGAEPRAGGWTGWVAAAGGGRRPLPELPDGPLLPANVVAALQAALLAGIAVDDVALAATVASARLRGRREVHRLPGGAEVFLDVAHNPAAVKKMVEYLNITTCNKRNVAIFSAMADKDLAGMVRAAGDAIQAWFVADQPRNPRAATAAALADVLRREGQGGVTTCGDLLQAYRTARAGLEPGDRLVIFGSFYTVGALLPLLDADLAGAAA